MGFEYEEEALYSLPFEHVLWGAFTAPSEFSVVPLFTSDVLLSPWLSIVRVVAAEPFFKNYVYKGNWLLQDSDT